MRCALPLALVLLAVPLAGCFDTVSPVELDFESGYPTYKPADGLYHFHFRIAETAGVLEIDFAPGAVSKLVNHGGTARSILLPENALLVQEDGETARFALPEGALSLAPGETRRFLAAPATTILHLEVDGLDVLLDPGLIEDVPLSWNQLVSGERWYEDMLLQQKQFPNRTPGMPNYAAAIAYFAETFEALGYEVEADPYGLTDLNDRGVPCVTGPTRGNICPATFANVVAMKPGTTRPDEILFVAGGHFDMVVSTTHAALDDTSGTLGTLELARALAPFSFERTIMFGLWGGEESGILGSHFWVRTHPVEAARILTYWNLDVIGATWPAPVETPDPLLVTAGPDVPANPRGDGSTADPVSGSLLAWAERLRGEYVGVPAEHMLLEGVAAGQLTGGANAQSDHTAFIDAGIPAYHSGRDTISPLSIHSEADTLVNFTKYARFGVEYDPDAPGWPAGAFEAEGRAALERSIETTLFFPLYHAVLTDLGVYEVPGRVSSG